MWRYQKSENCCKLRERVYKQKNIHYHVYVYVSKISRLLFISFDDIRQKRLKK